MFADLQSCTVTLLLNGVYRVYPVAERNNQLFAKIGKAAYIRILKGGNTTTKARWSELRLPIGYERGGL